jgi:hypothetical protein
MLCEISRLLMHPMHVQDSSNCELCKKMAPKRRIAGHSRTTQGVESSALDYGTIQHSTPKANCSVGQKQKELQEGSVDVTVGQALHKNVEILQQMTDRGTLCKEI